MADTTASGNLVQSSVDAYRKGIGALEQAYSDIQRIAQNVEETRTTLAGGYQGSDGSAFGRLVEQWEQQAVVILSNLQNMVDTLDRTLAARQQQQGSTNDSIDQAYSRSVSVFDALHG